MKHNTNPVPQMQVHTNLTAGESIDACQRNLEYWRRVLQQKCSGYPTPYLETEMKPWQAGGV